MGNGYGTTDEALGRNPGMEHLGWVLRIISDGNSNEPRVINESLVVKFWADRWDIVSLLADLHSEQTPGVWNMGLGHGLDKQMQIYTYQIYIVLRHLHQSVL